MKKTTEGVLDLFFEKKNLRGGQLVVLWACIPKIVLEYSHR